MAKVKTVFFCQNCGVQSAKWIGRCPSCGEWNTYVEEVVEKSPSAPSGHGGHYNRNGDSSRPLTLTAIPEHDEIRLAAPDSELNRVLGGGIVSGSLVLVGGEPGIGKSTLMLQLGLGMKSMKVLYVSGEESAQQIRMRASRLKSALKDENFYVLTETSLGQVFREMEALRPGLVIVDSIQTLYSGMIDAPAGSVSQIRQCAAELQRYAKDTGTPVFLIGHVTKDGAIAGPKVLEHVVDTVLQFEGDRNHAYRILRTLKNRFGSASELGIYEMLGTGLREVTNPSEILLSERDEPISGIAIAAAIEGLRPMLIETQALVSSAVYGTPQRSSTGFDLRRLGMLLAVLEKRCGFKFGVKDVFLNIAGGIYVEDPAIDLAVICALLSSYEDVPLPPGACFAGEVGLSGEIRAVNRVEQRIAEADKLGFEKIFISKYGKKAVEKTGLKIEVKTAARVDEIYGQLF